MTTTDWIIDIALVLLVIRQMREEKFSRRFVILPLAMVWFAASQYLHAIPTSGNNVVLVGACVVAGLVLGVAGGLLTRVRASDGTAYVQAGWGAASLWIGSMTARLLFIVWITHSGQASLVRFSVDHHITGGNVWATALVLLALSEVVSRIGVISLRALTAAERSKRDARQLVTV